jgi:hypothetical protein
MTYLLHWRLQRGEGLAAGCPGRHVTATWWGFLFGIAVIVFDPVEPEPSFVRRNVAQ